MPGCVIAVMMVIMMAGGRAETCCVMAVPIIGAQEDNKTGSFPVLFLWLHNFVIPRGAGSIE